MNCPHAERTVILTPELKHHGRIECANCGHFFGWAKKPATVAREQENSRLIVAARKLSLTGWEKEFVGSLNENGAKLSPKQQAALDKLAAKHSL